MYRLTFQWTEAGAAKSQTLALRDINGQVGTICLGRDPERADLVLVDPQKRVSRRHVEIFWHPPKQTFYLRNLTRHNPAGSQNPAIVDGQRVIGEDVPLQVGSQLQLGGFVVVVTDIQIPPAQQGLPESVEQPVFGVKCPNNHLISYDYLGLVCPHCGEAVQAGGNRAAV